MIVFSSSYFGISTPSVVLTPSTVTLTLSLCENGVVATKTTVLSSTSFASDATVVPLFVIAIFDKVSLFTAVENFIVIVLRLFALIEIASNFFSSSLTSTFASPLTTTVCLASS